jgi:hypothetical protein
MGALRLGLLTLQPTLETPSPLFNGELFGGLAFALVYMLPFAVSLSCLRLHNVILQTATWLAAALLGLLASFTTFSLVSLVLFPLPALLLLGAALLSFQTIERRQTGHVAIISAGLIILGSASWLLLFSQENPQCWALVRNTAGGETWESRPFSQGPVQLPADPGLGAPVTMTCSSDTITLAEAGQSLGLWLAGLILLFWLHRTGWPRWPVQKRIESAEEPGNALTGGPF